MLEVDGLDVFLGESHVLHDVSFRVPHGGITALLGRNGAGKTTTLRGILGLVERRGRVVLDGHDVSRAATHDIVRRGVGYVPENRDVFSQLTVQENLRLAERPGSPLRYDLVYELFPRLRERSGQRAGTMSGGEQQMLALARALLNGGNTLLLIDEPSQGLAPNLVREVAVALERMAQLATTLVVEQNLGVIRRIADQVVVLDQGRVVHAGPAGELFDDVARTRELLGVSHGEHGPPRSARAHRTEDGR
jgi:branched-chain amino acid transport system ATP-binding protein